MASLRPLARPSIQDLKIALFSPKPTYHARYLSTTAAHRRNATPRSSTLSYPAPAPTRPNQAPRAPATLPRSHDRGPKSDETTQTDFGNLDVLGATPVPSTSVDACLWDGFHLNNGVKVVGSGALLVGGEAFSWAPWKAGEGKNLLNAKGQWEVDDVAWGVLGLVWPKPGRFSAWLVPYIACGIYSRDWN
jgi:NADH dehydrogenase [ubiquinone] 1 alpha subcomplex assembly factor 3